MTGARDKPLRHAHSCCKQHDEEVASSKQKKEKRIQDYYQNGGKMAKIDTLFMTKAAEKLYPLAPHI